MTVSNDHQLAKLAAIITLGVVLYGCSPDCVNTIVTKVVSPNGTRVATVYKRDCGATTLENTQVAIRQKGEAFKAGYPGSIFIVETNKEVDVVWKSDTEILISFPSDSEIFRQEKQDGNVIIRYESQP